MSPPCTAILEIPQWMSSLSVEWVASQGLWPTLTLGKSGWRRAWWRGWAGKGQNSPQWRRVILRWQTEFNRSEWPVVLSVAARLRQVRTGVISLDLTVRDAQKHSQTWCVGSGTNTGEPINCSHLIFFLPLLSGDSCPCSSNNTDDFADINKYTTQFDFSKKNVKHNTASKKEKCF